jgi:hypothetical protein
MTALHHDVGDGLMAKGETPRATTLELAWQRATFITPDDLTKGFARYGRVTSAAHEYERERVE